VSPYRKLKKKKKRDEGSPKEKRKKKKRALKQIAVKATAFKEGRGGVPQKKTSWGGGEEGKKVGDQKSKKNWFGEMPPAQGWGREK